MKIYKVNNGAVIFDGNTYQLIHLDWNVLLIQDDPSTYLMDQLSEGQITQIQDHKILKPIGDNQELWACGVTYLRSKIGRQEESKTSGGSDFYEKVYHADRPEVFFKANPSRIVGHQEGIRIRQDSTWDVPEPELTLVVSPLGKIIAYTIGNDMSSRSIEGENPVTPVNRPDHFLDWLQCIRSGGRPNASIEAGYQHAVAVLMAQESYKTGRKAVYDSLKRKIRTK